MMHNRGFTLVEMLVAIAVSALLVSLVYGAVRIGQRSVNAMNSQTDNTEVMRIGWQFIHDAITRARPASTPDDADDQTGFDGASGGLELVADMPAYVGLGGLMRIGLETVDTDDARQLVLIRQRFDRTGTVDEPAEQRAVLVDDLAHVRLAYFGQDSVDAAPAWHSSWSGMSNLPNLVAVSVKPRNGREWPLLVARPLTGTAPLDEDDSVVDTTVPDDAADDQQ